MTEAIAVTTAASERGDEYRAVALASAAHFAMLALAALAGLGTALIAAGIIGVVAAIPLVCFGTDSTAATERNAAATAVTVPGMRAILTPTVLFLTGFFALLALSGTGIS